MQHGVKRVSLSEEARKAKIEKDKAKIAHYQQLTGEVFGLREDGNHSLEALDKVTELLVINPELYTMWNYRREILLDNKGEKYAALLDGDLKLVMGLLKRYPKCYWIWKHRVWCLEELVEIDKVNWEYEFAVVSKLLSLDSRNYHGWQYRRYVVKNIELQTSRKALADKVESALLDIKLNEFSYTTSKINNNISNFSAWHNRSKLIPQIFASTGTSEHADFALFKSPYTLLVHELELIKTGMYMDSDDTSVWLYLYWVLTDSLFVDALKSEEYAQSYLEVLEQQLKEVESLNELEKEEHIYNQDNCWCLKTIILIKSLIKREKGDEKELSDDVRAHLERLIEIDPLRKGKYLDQLAGKVKLV